MKKISIYSLNCPIDNSVKYIGKTENSLNARIADHLSCNGKNVEKNLWINSLKEKGLKPIINLIEIVDVNLWQLREGYWIEHYTNLGVKLFNKTLNENHPFVILNKYIAELKRRNYSSQTIKSYKSYFICYLRDFNGKEYKNIKTDEITSYLSILVETKSISTVHQNSLINAIKFYYEKVLKYQRQVYYIGRPRKASKIRPILTPIQVFQLIDSIKNLKQKTAMQLIYSGALRISEVVKIIVTDFDFVNNTVLIKCAKGKKDRLLTLPKQTVELVKIYLEQYKCDHWLFEGQDSTEHYSPKSIQIVFATHVKNLGFNPELTPHCLRHSRTAHTLNAGVKIEMASKYLGHSSISTTADIYYHYMTEDMRNQFDAADEKILQNNLLNEASRYTPKTIRQASRSH